MFTAPLIIISDYDIQHLSSTELFQGIYTVLAMDLHIHCKVEQKRKQLVFSGTNYKLITISITVCFF